ncbi:MAG: tetratricopeptide repeat protein [Verrucomicrobiales bacterium]|nr:tetratricopeptide repeat protein [Verrucomicrobiales bacterium]
MTQPLQSIEPESPGDITIEQEDFFNQQIVEGRHQQALAWLEATGDFTQRGDRVGRTLAARMLSILGDDRKSRLLHLKNYRVFPEDPVAMFYGAFSIDRSLGPLSAVDRISGFLEGANEKAKEDKAFAGLWAYLGSLESRFRDFSAAYRSFEIAERLDLEDTWIRVQRSQALLREDRTEEALEIAEGALALTPNYWAPMSEVADHYWAQNRDEECLALLERGVRDIEGRGPVRQLIRCYDEIEDYTRGLELLDEYEKRTPNADESSAKWIAANRASFLYQLGRGEEMIPHGKKADHYFYRQLIKRVKSGKFAGGRRVRLDVLFVRQNELTCAPATLTALSQFHGNPADHLEISEEICYDGTPDFKQRIWAEQQGWFVREFKANWKTTKALIDAGFPFALTTVEATSAHLQAVIGYDSRAGTIIIRDPGDRQYSESLGKKYYKGYQQCGPRAMVFVPMDRREELETIVLPESAEYDLLYEINHHLLDHDREAAMASLENLNKLSPGSRMSDQGAFILSSYDSDSAASLEIVERMAKRFPDSVRWEYSLYCRRYDRMSRDERIEYLEEKTKKDSVFTVYYKELAEILAEDASSLSDAKSQFRRALRFRPYDAEVYYGLAGLLWKDRQFKEATAIYRIALCLSERTERYASSYFRACRWVNQTDEGLSMLRLRYQRFGGSSGSPAITLASSLRALDQDEEVPELLGEALTRSPADGELISYAANYFAGIRRVEKAQQLVEEARGKISEVERWRVLARIAELDSDPSESLRYWRKVSEVEPLAMDAHRSIAAILNEATSSDQESVEHLQNACREYPFHVPLHECLIGWLRDQGPGVAEVELRKLVEKHPSHSWGWRELALDLGQQLRFDEAQEAAIKSVDLCPENTFSHSIRGLLFEDAQDPASAKEHFRAALEIDVENSSALRGLVRTSGSIDEKRNALQFIEEQLQEQVLFGETMHTYRQIAFSVLEPDELLDSLKRANEARPDLWETWSSLIDQYTAMDNMEEAKIVAIGQSERFPMMPRSWFDLAAVWRHSGDREKEIETLEKCLTLNPQWTLPLRRLADALTADGELERAIEILEKAVKEGPLEPANHGCLGDLLWKTGRRDEAFDVVLRAVRIDSSYGWGWESLGEWAPFLDRKDEAIAEGKRLTETLPLNWKSWNRLADLYGELGNREKQFEVLKQGLEHLPLSADLRDYMAWLHCQSGRYQDALEQCSESRWPANSRPRKLAGREAWVESRLRGNQAGIEKMVAVVKEHPDYYWAHECLGDWYTEEKELTHAEESARQLIRLSPTEPQPHGTLAKILLEQKRSDEAREELGRAFSLSNSYAYAGYHLVRMDLEAGDYSSANEVLQVLEFNHPEMPGSHELRCRLEAGLKNKDAAIDAFSRLCKSTDVAAAALERAEDMLLRLINLKEITEFYRDVLSSGDVKSEDVIDRWLKRVFPAQKPESVAISLRNMSLEGTLLEKGWQGLIYRLNDLNQRKKAIKIVRANRDVYQGNARLWASAGFLLREEGRKSELRAWMEGWSDRDGLRPWMLINFALNELLIGGVQAAGPLHLFASAELPEEHDTWQHYGCAAYFEAARGRLESARIFLEKGQAGPEKAYYSSILALARFRIETMETGECQGELFRDTLKGWPEWSEDREFRVYLRDTLKAHWKELLCHRKSSRACLHAILVCVTNIDLT